MQAAIRARRDFWRALVAQQYGKMQACDLEMMMRSLSGALAGLLALTALGACTEEPLHPVERYLSRLQPVTIAPLDSLGWPAGTVLCAMTPYQSQVSDSAPEAERVNAYLKRKQFLGEEMQWSLVLIKPAPAGDDGIEHLVFRNGDNAVVNEPDMLKQAAETIPAGFQPQACVPVEHARVLVARGRGYPRVVAFGRQAH